MLPFNDKLLYSVPTKLPDKLIESIIEYIELQHVMQSSLQDKVIDNTIRSSKNGFINWDEWIPGILHNMFVVANEAYFQYDICTFDSKIQTTIYEEGDHYDWHTDANRPTGSYYNGKERKLSITLCLSDPEEYTGGELEFKYHHLNQSLKLDKGEAIIFPSWLPHRVAPIKSGKRISLVAWMNGNLWK